MISPVGKNTNSLQFCICSSVILSNAASISKSRAALIIILSSFRCSAYTIFLEELEIIFNEIENKYCSKQNTWTTPKAEIQLLSVGNRPKQYIFGEIWFAPDLRWLIQDLRTDHYYHKNMACFFSSIIAHSTAHFKISCWNKLFESVRFTISFHYPLAPLWYYILGHRQLLKK